MFALFYSLYISMFRGVWYGVYNLSEISNQLKPIFNSLGNVVTSMFNNVTTPVTDFGDIMFDNNQPYLCLVAFILALITSIGIVVMAVKGIKRVFGVFFMGLR